MIFGDTDSRTAKSDDGNQTDPRSVSPPGENPKNDAIPYDAILIVGFGGPERRDDVLPFLENVTRGRNVPRERLLEVAEHYDHFGGVSPINAQIRELIAALRPELDRHGISLPIFWGNRNWHPMLADTLAEMTAHGVKRALAVVLAAYSSYSSCRQYREDIARAQAAVGPGAPRSTRCGSFTITPTSSPPTPIAFAKLSSGSPPTAAQEVHIAFTAHSIPVVDGPELRVRAPARRSVPIGRRTKSAFRPSAGRSSTRAGAGGPAIPGSSRISSIISRT